MSNTEHLFIELLQVSLGEKEQLSQIPSHIEWATLYEEAERQAIVGVMMDGLERFAGAVMWMMKEVLKLEYKYLIVETDEKRGRILMDEVMKGGNFGHQDKRMARRFMR